MPRPLFSYHKNESKQHRVLSLCVIVLTLSAAVIGYGGERSIVRLIDFEKTEVKGDGFVLPAQTDVHIRAKGNGDTKGGLKFTGGENQLAAYGWIINADTRELVWVMDFQNSHRDKDYRVFDGTVTLPKGTYEVYFAAYAFYANLPLFSYTINIDRRKTDNKTDDVPRKHGLFSWIEDLFTGDIGKEWRKQAQNWGIELFIPDAAPQITEFTPPKDFPHLLYHAIKLGELEHIRQGFAISKETPIRIYALGEESADYGWIIDVKTRKRVWDMGHDDLLPAGGARKNVKFDRTVTFSPGEYILYYITDNSHSCDDWNAAPPSDPLNYGVSLIANDPAAEEHFELSSPKEDKNAIVSLVRVGDNETRSASFTLKKEATLHIYAIGERGNSRRQMADYGWIINAKTREKVWTMDVDRTEHAGGADKNRMADELISLPSGTYTAFFQTDDSHAYNDWNSTPPYDQEHYGLTISLEGDQPSSIVETNVTPKETGVLAQIIRVGDHADRTETFRIDRPTKIRIYAIGEGEDHEMFDYGWIEEGSTGNRIWEMSYDMTFHAGGARKNRMVNTTIMLDKGEYRLRFVSDDSHSYNNWNADPPDDPTMWGITIYEER